MTYNYYKATFSVVTARRAKLLGILVWRCCASTTVVRRTTPYGYYVLIDPPVTTEGRCAGRVRCWCKTKQIADEQAESYRESQRRGYWGCPCGSGRQRRRCCG